MTESRPRSTLFRNGGDIPDQDMSQVLISGFMTKEGGSWKSWKRRYFVLSSSGDLVYYEDETKTKPKGYLDCRSAEVHPSPTDGPLYFEIVSDVFGADQSGRVMKILAESEPQMIEWIVSIREVSCLYGDKIAAINGDRGKETVIEESDCDPLC